MGGVGDESSKTTEIYTHITKRARIRSKAPWMVWRFGLLGVNYISLRQFTCHTMAAI
jgi:hypothetical protein